MIAATVCGNIGSDSEIRQAGNSKVCSFSVASTTKKGSEESTTWVRCSFFGSRGEALSQYLTKGTTVAVTGTLTTREYNGKTQVELNVSDLKLMGGNKQASGGGGSKPNKPAARQQSSFDGPEGGGDDLPF